MEHPLNIVIKDPNNQWLKFKHIIAERPVVCWIKGFAWLNGAFLNTPDLFECLVDCLLRKPHPEFVSCEEIKQNLFSLDGNFAFVIVYHGTLIATVDCTRSTPLFYGVHGGRFCISNDAREVRHFVNKDQLDELSSIEFLLTGYVTGSDTLYSSLKQLQAGEFISVDGKNIPVDPVHERYFRYQHGSYYDATVYELSDAFDTVLTNSIENLVLSTEGRQLVLPLSAGLDSRLIAATLKRIGFENVVCFSYGYEGHESEKSKQTAQKLGYPWKFVPYSRSQWLKWFRSSELQEYSRYADGLTTTPHLQDWPAVMHLRKNHAIDPNAVFVPGHTCDFLAGGHIPTSFNGAEMVGERKLVKNIWEKHYSLWTLSGEFKEIEKAIQRRILDRVETPHFTKPETAASAFETWEWQERQAKWIVNSVRVYEFWGYEWRIPYWDRSMMQFWSRVPLPLKFGRMLQKHYATYTFPSVFTENLLGNIVTPQSIQTKLQNTPIHWVYRTLVQLWPSVRAYSGIIDYWQDYVGWYGINPFVRYLALRKTNVTINNNIEITVFAPTAISSYIALDFLNELQD